MASECIPNSPWRGFISHKILMTDSLRQVGLSDACFRTFCGYFVNIALESAHI